MGTILACSQCGVRFVAQLSLGGEVSCPRCGAVAVESVRQVTGSRRSSGSPIQGLYPRVVCTHCRAKLVPPWPVSGGQPIQCRRCNTIFAAPGAFYGYAVEFQYRPLPEGGNNPDEGWEKISADQVIAWQTPGAKRSSANERETSAGTMSLARPGTGARRQSTGRRPRDSFALAGIASSGIKPSGSLWCLPACASWG
jgi:DNA-directed RNA polymerase subunit RPC12/RpoP